MRHNREQPSKDQTPWLARIARIAAALRRLWHIVAPSRAGRLRGPGDDAAAAVRLVAPNTGDTRPSVENDGAVHDQVHKPDPDQSCEPDRAHLRPSNEIIDEPPPIPPSVSPEVQEIGSKQSDSEAVAADEGALLVTTTEADHRNGGEDHQDLESEASEYEQTDSRCKGADDESDQGSPDEDEGGEADSQEPLATDVPGPNSGRSRSERKIKPEKRGGRRRGPPIEVRTGPHRQGQPDGQSRKPRPELVCWFQGMARGWTIGVEVPDGLQLPTLQVRQAADIALEEEGGSRGGRWRLKNPLGSVKFAAADLDQESAVPLEVPAAQYRIFRIVGAHGDRGRAVRQGTTGHFLVVVPQSWQWNEELSGAPSSGAPEFVSPGTARAHHVELPLEAGRTLAFTTPEGDCVRVPCARQRFELVGPRVDDASEEVGPLFVGEPPRLQCSGGFDESATPATVVVGEEGPADGWRRWRVYGKQFDDLRPAITEQGTGWFFARLYDSNDELIESLDFRFVANLEAIKVQATSPTPGPYGHSAARIHFRHGRESSVRCCSAHPLASESVHDGSIAIVPPDAQFDATRWRIGPVGGRAVDVTILVERVWWARARGDTARDQQPWTDHALELCREDFDPTSSTAIVLKLPRAGWAAEVRIGFEAARSRLIHLSASEQECVIPLRELGEFREIEERSAECLKTWLTRTGHEGESLEAVVGRLPGDVTLLVGMGTKTAPMPAQPGAPRANRARRKVRRRKGPAQTPPTVRALAYDVGAQVAIKPEAKLASRAGEVRGVVFGRDGVPAYLVRLDFAMHRSAKLYRIAQHHLLPVTCLPAGPAPPDRSRPADGQVQPDSKAPARKCR